ncbi:uncharacterized protein LOC130786087 [Actinidia eriantha]|uniref:uncharacterized protein LOC130786087 n=1 Tax=Actinidia eriantha TaxID=165200 RepID=UPI0025867404|nr:uncharacterized protein LOC130786087 [Actinidia eriantha]
MKNLHPASFWFNPSYQYNPFEMAKHRKTTSDLLDVIEKYAYGNPTLRSKLTKEIKLFRNAEQDFGRVSSVSDRNVMLPDEWWLCYGNNAPNLQKLAIRVLSQTCSTSDCERNWSIFEHIHSKKRNRLEHQRLYDLIYVHYNLRLQQRTYFKGRNYDPIDFEDFSANSIWVLEDEPPTLTADELESFRRELASLTIQESQNIDDTLNLDELDDIDDDKNDGNEVVGQEGNWSGGLGRVTNVGPSNENEIDDLDFGTDLGSSSGRGNQWNIEHP